MKKKTFLLSAICLLFVVCFALTGCGKVSYKIEFIVDNSVYSTLDTTGNETIKLPDNPTKDGYIFDGWYWDEDTWTRPFTANSLLNEPLSSDMKVYAKWSTEDSLKGTQAEFNGFNKVDDSTYSITISNDTQILNFSDLVSINNKSSWALYRDIYATDIIPSKIATFEVGDNKYYVLVTANTGDIKLYTLNIRRKPLYLVTFDTLNGSVIQSQNIEEDSFAVLPNQPTKTGYTFINWDFDFSTPIISNITIRANYQPNSYKINYLYESNKVEQVAVYDSNVIIENNDLFSKTAYNLVSWNTKIDGSGTNYNLNYEFEKYNLTSDLNLYPIWTPINYNIIYHLFDGVNGDNVSSYNIETPTFNLVPAEKDGYQFDGWFTDSDFENPITQIEQGSYGNIELYSSWKTIDYNIIYYTDGAEENTNPTKYTIEDSIDLQSVSKEGYTFEGWYTEDNFENKIEIIEKGNIGDIELYAKFSLINYLITYQYNGGEEVDNILEYNIETPTFNLIPAQKDGYRFDGWFIDSEFENQVTQIEQGSYGDLNLYAKFTNIEFLAYYHSNFDSAEIIRKKIVYNETINILGNDTYSKTGYNLTKWNTSADGTGQDYLLNQIIESYDNYSDLHLYAVWTAKNYVVNLNTNGGVCDISTINTTFDTPYDTLPLPTRVAYRFDGWYYNNKKIEDINWVYDTTEIVAQWTPIFLTTIYNNEITITGLSEYGKTLENMDIPDKIDNIAVCHIGSNAMTNNNTIKSLTLPSSIKTISYNAFLNCKNILTINYNCEDCSMSGSNFENVGINTNGTTLNIGKNVKHIPDKAFFPGYSSAVPNYISNIKLVNFENNFLLESVGKGAFRNVPIERVNIDNISNWAKIDFDGETANPAMPNKLYINNQLLGSDIMIDSSNNRIGSYAFYNCYFENIEIAEGVRVVGGWAFAGSEFKTITLPKSLIEVEISAFYSKNICVEKIVYNGTLSDWVNIDFDYTPFNDPVSNFEFYINNEKVTEIVISNDIKLVKKRVFTFLDNTSISIKFENPDLWYYASNDSKSDEIAYDGYNDFYTYFYYQK